MRVIVQPPAGTDIGHKRLWISDWQDCDIKRQSVENARTMMDQDRTVNVVTSTYMLPEPEPVMDRDHSRNITVTREDIEKLDSGAIDYVVFADSLRIHPDSQALESAIEERDILQPDSTLVVQVNRTMSDTFVYGDSVADSDSFLKNNAFQIAKIIMDNDEIVTTVRVSYIRTISGRSGARLILTRGDLTAIEQGSIERDQFLASWPIKKGRLFLIE